MTVDEMVRRAVAAAPPLTEAQRAVIAQKLRPVDDQPVVKEEIDIERTAA